MEYGQSRLAVSDCSREGLYIVERTGPLTCFESKHEINGYSV